MMFTPELNAMSPLNEQIEAFETLQQRKEFFVAKDMGT
jgi:hypothetical protein